MSLGLDSSSTTSSSEPLPVADQRHLIGVSVDHVERNALGIARKHDDLLPLASLGAAGRRYAEADHGWDAVLNRIFGVYRGIVAS